MPFDVDNEDDIDLDRIGATGSIIPPPLDLRVMFNIAITVIQLLNIMSLF